MSVAASTVSSASNNNLMPSPKSSSNILSRFAGKGVYPHQLAWLLLLPLRNLYLSPRTLVRRLNLKADSVVLELGCGPGYFSPTVARAVPQGTLHLTDIQPEMLERARRRLQKKGVTNVELRLCPGNVLPYDDAMVDVIFLVTVLGEISEQELYVQEMARVLRPGGTLSVSEQGGDPDSMSVAEIEALLRPAGFVPGEVFGRGRTFTANFKKS